MPDLLDVVTHELREVCEPGRLVFVQGRYEDTLPQRASGEAFNLVHIDCDWYESSMVVYNYLREHLAQKSIIQVDDYSDWEGSRRAFSDAVWLHQYHTHLIDGALVINTVRDKQGKLI
jgi:hypothetical protein